jgi:hypothetical protein
MTTLVELSRTLPCFKHANFVEHITVHNCVFINVDVVCIERSRRTSGLERNLARARKQMLAAKPKHILYTFIVLWYDGTLTQEKLREFVTPTVNRIIDEAERLVDEKFGSRPSFGGSSDFVARPAIEQPALGGSSDEAAQPASAE